MEIYGLRQKKKKKWWLIPVIAAAVVFALIFTVGIIVNVTNADHSAITQSVRENAELKRQIEDLNAKIANLQSELEGTRRELDARPTAAPEATDLPASPEPQEGAVSPRNFQ